MSEGEDLRTLVLRALDNGLRNGFFDETLRWEPERLAMDLLDCDADIEDYAGRRHGDRCERAVAELVPLIREWRMLQGGK